MRSAILAATAALFVACDRSSSSVEVESSVGLVLRVHAGGTVPSVGWVQAKLVRPGRDSQVVAASYAASKGGFLSFAPIATGDSFVVVLTGYDSTAGVRILRWSTVAEGVARIAPVQVVDLAAIDSVASSPGTAVPSSAFVGASFDLQGIWKYTVDGSDPRSSASARAIAGALVVDVPGRWCLARATVDRRGDTLWGDSGCWSFERLLDTSLHMQDASGRVYSVVRVGGRKWMGENLAVPADGSRCYGDDTANCRVYGRLYSWNEARRSCPAGWHLPMRAEWLGLLTGVESSQVPQALQSTAGWPASSGASNSTGFAALPAGYFLVGTGQFVELGAEARFWGGDSGSQDSSHPTLLLTASGVRLSTYDRNDRFSVRCVADLPVAP